MTRLCRWGVLYVLCGLVLAGDPADDLERYRELLARWRGGAVEVRAELAQLGTHLCREHARCDAQAIATYYLGLDAQALARGLEAEASVDAIRLELAQAGEQGLDGTGEDWPSLRRKAMARLEQLAVPDEDVVPAARARALLARLELSIVEDDPSQSEESRRDWITSATRHVGGSIALFERCGMVTPRLEPLWIRGRLARARGDWRTALAEQSRCLHLAEMVGNLRYQERALIALAELARDGGDPLAARRYLADLAQRVDPSESWPLAREHAIDLLGQDRSEAALAFLLAHPARAASNQESWHALLTAAYLRTGDTRAAEREAAGLDPEGEIGRLARAAVALATGSPQRALEQLDGERESFSTRGWVEALVMQGEAYLDLGDRPRARTVLDQALEAAEHWAGRGYEEDYGGGSVMGEWLGLHAITLAARVRAEEGDPVGAATLIEDAQTRALRPPGARVGREELRSWAARYERGLVTWSVGPDRTTCAWVGADGSGGAATIEQGRAAFRGAVRRLREAAIAGETDRVRLLGAEIRATLLPAELRRDLATSDPDERLLLCLHGPLEGLPLSLLDLPLTPVVLPGLPSGGPGPTSPPEREYSRWRLLGAPTGGPGPPLPEAARELAALARRYPSAPLASGAAFRRGALLEALASRDALHVATHLAVDPRCADPRFSSVGLELSGGEILCAAELLEARVRAPLIVLSACDTASGRMIDAEGAHGLARALLEAGAEDLVVTLWPVTDEASAAFGLAFHEALAQDPIPSRAVRRARRILAQRGLGAGDWAAFRAMGRH